MISIDVVLFSQRWSGAVMHFLPIFSKYLADIARRVDSGHCVVNSTQEGIIQCSVANGVSQRAGVPTNSPSGATTSPFLTPAVCRDPPRTTMWKVFRSYIITSCSPPLYLQGRTPHRRNCFL